MTDTQFDDFKQLLETTVSQSETRLRTEIQAGFARMDEGFAGVAESLENISDLIDRDYKQTNRRLTRLEQHPV